MAKKTKGKPQMEVTWHPTDKRTPRKEPERPEEPPAAPYADIFTRFSVEPEFHAAFATFIETGTAPAEFTYRLERNAHWQLALEEAFERRVGRLQEVLRVLIPAEEKPENGGE